jgi:hypothetical protein
MRLLFMILAVLSSPVATAQWAVYDKKVHEQLTSINQIREIKGSEFTKLDRHFKNQLGAAAANGGGDLTLGDGDSKAVLKALDTIFDELTELSDEDKKKYLGTVQDCGDDKLNPAHFQACAGLRNLRLQTLKQSQSLLKTLDARRKQIVQLVEKSRSLGANGQPLRAGELQRYQFELQAQQALLQTDAMQLQILMDGYRQRENVYEMQMAEARRATDTRPPGSLVKLGAVPFSKDLMKKLD